MSKNTLKALTKLSGAFLNFGGNQDFGISPRKCFITLGLTYKSLKIGLFFKSIGTASVVKFNIHACGLN